MRWIGALLVGVACESCSLTEGGSFAPDFPPPIFPPSLTVTEGDLTGFWVGLQGPVSESVAGGFYEGTTYCPTAPVTFAPCNVVFAADEPYPAQVAMIGARDPDANNEKVRIRVYFPGETGAEHAFTAYVVDTDAPNVVASNWNLTLPPSGTAELGVRLTQPPIEPVTVQLQPGSTSPALSLSATSLQFGLADYDVFQTITVSNVSGWGEIVLAPSNSTPWGSVRVSQP